MMTRMGAQSPKAPETEPDVFHSPRAAYRAWCEGSAPQVPPSMAVPTFSTVSKLVSYCKPLMTLMSSWHMLHMCKCICLPPGG